MLWVRGAAVSLSPPQGKPSPLLWSPWQPQHQHLPPLGLSTKVNWWLKISLNLIFAMVVMCLVWSRADSRILFGPDVLCFNWSGTSVISGPALKKTHPHTQTQRTNEQTCGKVKTKESAENTATQCEHYHSLQAPVRCVCVRPPNMFSFKDVCLLAGRLYDEGGLTVELRQSRNTDKILFRYLASLQWHWEGEFSSWVCFFTVVLSWAHTWKLRQHSLCFSFILKL